MTVSLLLAAGFTSYALEDWKGRVTDSSGEPVAYANVVLLSREDSTVVSGTITDESGSYILPTDEDGILMVAMMGYMTMYAEPSEDGNIRLQEDASVLEGAVATGMMVKTRITSNSMVTDIQGTVLGTSGSVLEMLGKVPGMMAKGNELEVIGKGAPVIYINGRKLHDMNELKQMRSEDVQSVEVINNPGAQYDATVTAVVRIRTLRHEGEGFGFDLKMADNQDLVFGASDPSATLNLRYRFTNLDIFGSVNYWKWDEISIYEDDGHMILNSNDSVIQDHISNNHWYSSGMDYNVGFNWQLAENHSVGARVVAHQTVDAGTYLTSVTDIRRNFGGSESLIHNTSVQNEKRNSPYDWEGNLYYSGLAGKLNINFNADYLMSRKDMVNSISDIVNDTDHTEMLQEGVTTSRLGAAKLVLTYPIWKGQLEAGTETTFVERGSSHSITNYPLPSSDSEVDESNISAFVSFVFSLQKFGSFNAGIRYEHVGFNYTDLLDAGNSMSRYQDEFFPNLAWSGQFGPVQASLSYSLRTSRPSYNDLGDRIQYINSFTLMQGDSRLKNEKMQEIGMNARYKWLNLSVAYERKDNTLTNLFYNYNGEGMLLVRASNLSEPMRSVTAFVSANPTWGVYSPNCSAGVRKQWNVEGFDRPIFNFAVNNAFRFKHSWQLEANMNIRTKGDNINFRMTTPMYNLGFVVQKCWLKNDALCLRVSVEDVLKRSMQDVYSISEFFIYKEHPFRNYHRLDISLRYTFNASKSRYKGIGAGKDAQSRM